MSRFQIQAAVVSGCLCLVAAVAVGQQASPLVSTQPTQQDDTFLPRKSVYSFYVGFEGRRGAADLTKRVSEATRTFAAAETDDERADAERQLREVVAEQFDSIVKQREEQITELQARLERLNQQLEERQTAKDEIVDLRVKVLVNEAKGLGFYPSQNGFSRQTDPYSNPGVFGNVTASDRDATVAPVATPRPPGSPPRGRR